MLVISSIKYMEQVHDIKKGKVTNNRNNFLYIWLGVVVVLLAIGIMYLNSNLNIYTGNISKPANVIAENNTSSYKKIAYIGFQKIGQPFWTSMGKYLESAASVRKIFYTDLTSDILSPQKQIESLKLAIDQHVDGIILGPTLPSELITVLDSVYKAKIPVVVVDTEVKSPAVVSFIATNNLESARLAGDYIVSNNKTKGTVLILCGEKNHPNSMARERGVREKTEKAGIKTIARYTNWQIEKAYSFTKEELAKPNNNIKAIFSCFDPGIISAEKAVEEAGIGGKIVLVGFDGLQETYKLIQSGKIAATVAQPIKQMARESIEKILSYINGDKIETENLIPGIMVTKNNLGYFLD